jgi:hypothetical protein
MARRRFEMHHHRQALLRMRQGDSDRDIAAAKIMGRRKAGDLRRVALAQGWLEPECALPGDETVALALAPARQAASTISSLEGHRQAVQQWVQQGVSGTAIHLALQRGHGWSGSYSAVRRLVRALRAQGTSLAVGHCATLSANQFDAILLYKFSVQLKGPRHDNRNHLQPSPRATEVAHGPCSG